jgi:hypothetical protein
MSECPHQLASCIIFSKNFVEAILGSATPVVLDFGKLDTYQDFTYQMVRVILPL